MCAIKKNNPIRERKMGGVAIDETKTGLLLIIVELGNGYKGVPYSNFSLLWYIF